MIDTTALTPVISISGDRWVKRDDTFSVAGVMGGKVRTCWVLSHDARGLVTAGSRASPQVNIVAHIARHRGIPCRVHTPTGELSPEVRAARDCGAVVIQHPAGYNNVIIRRARDDAARLGWVEIPFGMECQTAIEQTAIQVANIPGAVQRLVVPVGSGMSLAGILHGLREYRWHIPILGVVVGACPRKRLNRYAPPGWERMVSLIPAGVDYHRHVSVTLDGILLDPIYEAKCVRFLSPGDLLWCVGIRQTAVSENLNLGTEWGPW